MKPATKGLAALAVAGLSLSAVMWRYLSAPPQPVCRGEAFSLTDALIPTFDFVELRERGDEVTVLERAGLRCGAARDRSRCEAAFNALAEPEGWHVYRDHRNLRRFLVATRGDEVLAITNEQTSLRRALAPIDSPAKAAAMVAVSQGLGIDCESVSRGGDGWDVHHEADNGCSGASDVMLHVSLDGAITVISSKLRPATCMD